jgi:hypothetical protein
MLSLDGDVDEIVRRAQAADATIVPEPALQPSGHGRLRRPRRAPLDGD